MEGGIGYVYLEELVCKYLHAVQTLWVLNQLLPARRCGNLIAGMQFVQGTSAIFSLIFNMSVVQN